MLYPEPLMPIGVIESLDNEARGIACQEDKAIFVDGALPGEIVEYASFRRKPGYEIAHLAVSYTHLDVYKRQVTICYQAPFRCK